MPGFASQLVCVARSWKAQNFVESTKDNSDSWILDLWRCYLPPGAQVPGARAYCWVFVSVAIADAARLSGCQQIKWPTYSETYGNTRRGMEILRGRFLRIATPEPGAVFYRRSLGCSISDHKRINIDKMQGTCSSGHAGIVIGVDRDYNGVVTQFHTVEGNASREAQDHSGIAEYVYTPNGPTWYTKPGDDWYFFRLDADCVPKSGRSCMSFDILCGAITKAELKQPVKKFKPSFDRELSLVDKLNDGATVDEYVQEKTAKKEDCKSLLVRSCCDDSEGAMMRLDSTIPNYRILKNRPEIFSGFIGGSANIPSFRDPDLTAHTAAQNQLPAVTDNAGNLYFFLVEGSPKHKYIEGLSLWGLDPFVLDYVRTGTFRVLNNAVDGDGAGWKERVATISQPFRDIPGGGNWGNHTALQMATSTRNSEKLKRVDPREYAPLIEYANIWKMLEAGERHGKYPESIVVLLSGEPTTIGDIYEDISSVLLPVLTNVATSFGIPAGLVKSGLAVADKAARKLPLTIDDLFDVSKSVLVTSGYPEAAEEYIGYAEKTKGMFGAFQSGNLRDGAARAADLLSTVGTKHFPEEVEWLSQKVSSAKLFFEGATHEIEKITGAPRDIIDAVSSSFASAEISRSFTFGIQNLGSVDAVADRLFSKLADAVSDYGAAPLLENLNIFRRFLTSVPHGTMLSSFPLMPAIAKKTFSISDVFRANIGDDVQRHGLLASIAAGFSVADNALDDLQFSAFMKQAELFAEQKLLWGLPAHLEAEKRECWESEIRICTGVECCAPRILWNGTCQDARTIDQELKQATILDPKYDSSGGGRASDVQEPGIRHTDTDVKFEAGRGAGAESSRADAGSIKQDIRIPACMTQLGADYVYCPPAHCGDGPVPAIDPSALPTRQNFAMPLEQELTSLTAARDFFFSVQSSPDATEPCAVQYSARVVGRGTPSERWYALINGTWIEIRNCCPTWQPESCCERNHQAILSLRSALDSIQAQLLGAISRAERGQPDYSDKLSSIQRAIDALQLKAPEVAVDTAQLQNQLTSLRAQVEALRTGMLDLDALRNELSLHRQDLAKIINAKALNIDYNEKFRADVSLVLQQIKDQLDSLQLSSVGQLNRLEAQLQESVRTGTVDVANIKDQVNKALQDHATPGILSRIEAQLSALEQRGLNTDRPDLAGELQGLLEHHRAEMRALKEQSDFAGINERDSKEQSTRAQQTTERDCPDCPKVVERRIEERFIYSFPKTQECCQ